METIKKSIAGIFYALLASIVAFIFFAVLFAVFNLPSLILLRAAFVAAFLSIIFGAVVGAKGWETQTIFVKGLAFSSGVMILPSPSIATPILSALYETAALSRDSEIFMGFIVGGLGGAAAVWSLWGKNS